MDALIKLVFLPEATGERGRAAEKTAVDPEHLSSVDEMALDAIAGGTTFVEGATELDDEANALAVVAGGIEVHWTEVVVVLSREGKNRFGTGAAGNGKFVFPVFRNFASMASRHQMIRRPPRPKRVLPQGAETRHYHSVRLRGRH